MLVTTATVGVYARKARSLSSASTTNSVPPPSWALLPVDARSAPTAYDGSAPTAVNATASIDEVVLLPCVPVTASTIRPIMTDTTAADRGHNRSPCSRAATTSGLDSSIAVDTTTVSAPLTWSARWPT